MQVEEENHAPHKLLCRLVSVWVDVGGVPEKGR